MKLYRSIGEKELKNLLQGYPIHGIYPSGCIDGSDCEIEKRSVVCFYTEPFMWSDKEHKHVIICDIPEEELTFGTATYLVSKDVIKKRQWSGRDGSELLKLSEAYVDTYTIKNVKIVYLCEHYASWYIEEHIKPYCIKNGVILNTTENNILNM